MKPFKFAQFFKPSVDGSQTIEAVGSDGVYYPLDQRLSTTNMTNRIQEHMIYLNKTLNCGYTHYQIRFGTFTSYTNLTELIKFPLNDFKKLQKESSNG